MEITNLSALSLINEISGFSYGDKSVKGIMNEEFSLKAKYHVRNLFKELSVYKESILESYKEWASKSGSDDFQKFLGENEDLMMEKVSLKDCPVTIDDLDFKSEYSYPFFMSIVIDKES